jgi:multisubunit Na+/H+ antiporter MnhB subunit
MAERGLRLLLTVLVLIVTAGLALGLQLLPRQPGLAERVWQRQAALDLEQPVTAVLLGFRAYDTLLEVAVLVLSALAVLVLVPPRKDHTTQPITAGPAPSPLMLWLLPRLIPLVLLVAAYLWWAGGSQPGGAFQAGTVLSAAGVIMLLSQRLRPPAVALGTRLLVCQGLLIFFIAGVLTLPEGSLLQYPAGWAKPLIVVIELALALSIAGCFVLLVVGVPSYRLGHFPGDER